MVTKTLSEYVEEHGQVKTGLALGISQTAISKALRHRRNIIVEVQQDGTICAREVKPFPSQKAAM
ncbi:TPA: Cro/Cl family transcriptional regulator [Kluyvera intermedia]|uniref:Cro/Cl family transcriptional regulator n=1 Tax=Kluyvera intermedia TaxID=61648 RepID=A0A9P3TDT0_KLUIN|nr:Cro/CI family transcriptional regulator [Phytobacter ursingii]HAT2207692.1 Cro/Cl family transcriptional regulator [Kluyvera intermedia]HAT2518377.1 Cro/Cl family transcriptional regulator [Kluyvera intermedia]HAT2606501.1 Cro/Cl family transcriptional regulator [Kluyvera intermedia]HAT2683269.1 Cro/Cl family transcriptional regulator [Kluyvera intermedia]HAT2699801.1 Cro/Cl family transcriptional regulator [Kluyvera intermedia]